jgi:hypothetical protein
VRGGDEVKRRCLKGEEESDCEEEEGEEEEEEEEEACLSIRVSAPRLGGASEPDVVLRGVVDVELDRSTTTKREALGRSGVIIGAVGVVVVEGLVATLVSTFLERIVRACLRSGVVNLMGGLLSGGVEGSAVAAGLDFGGSGDCLAPLR